MIVIKHRKSADVVLLRVNARRLDDQDLTGAYLLGADMAGLRGRRLILREASLRNASLRGADLRGAVLQGAVLRGADLRNCNLSDARLAEADLRGADLRGADLRGADLSRSMLFEANLAGVRCDQRTCWPQGECWGLLARPAVSEPAGAWSPAEFVADAQQWVVRGLAAHRFVPTRQPQAAPLLGRAYRLVGVGLALALVAAVTADLHSRRNSASVPPVRLPRMAAQVSQPEPPESTKPRIRQVPTPARHSAPPAAPRLERRPRRAHPRAAAVEPHRLAAAHVAPAPVTRSQVAGLRLAQRSTTGNSTPAAPAAGSGTESTQHAWGGTARAGRVLQAAYMTPPRRQGNPMTERVAPSPEPGPPVEVAAGETPRPKSRSEARRKSPAVAWGNSEFHYGSGYDIYSMHLGPDPE